MDNNLILSCLNAFGKKDLNIFFYRAIKSIYNDIWSRQRRKLFNNRDVTGNSNKVGINLNTLNDSQRTPLNGRDHWKYFCYICIQNRNGNLYSFWFNRDSGNFFVFFIQCNYLCMAKNICIRVCCINFSNDTLKGRNNRFWSGNLYGCWCDCWFSSNITRL